MNRLPETPILETTLPASTGEGHRSGRLAPVFLPTPMPAGPRSQPPPTGILLTRREREVAAWLGEDITCDGIARRLGVSRETIRAHLRNIGRKLGVRTRHAMVARLVTPGIGITK